MFKGEHLKHKKAVTVLTGKEISVEFDSPRPLQVDGETLLGITKHTVKFPIKAENKVEETI
jgi:diacylglycerol kinase family enzyme